MKPVKPLQVSSQKGHVTEKKHDKKLLRVCRPLPKGGGILTSSVV